jgi:hypothetical protein
MPKCHELALSRGSLCDLGGEPSLQWRTEVRDGPEGMDTVDPVHVAFDEVPAVADDDRAGRHRLEESPGRVSEGALPKKGAVRWSSDPMNGDRRVPFEIRVEVMTDEVNDIVRTTRERERELEIRSVLTTGSMVTTRDDEPVLVHAAFRASVGRELTRRASGDVATKPI